MHHFTLDKKNPKREIMLHVHHAEKLDSSIFKKYLFSIIFMKKGYLNAEVDKETCHFHAPIIICLDELKDVKILSTSASDIKILYFDPIFLNVNMKISTLRQEQYASLCEQHAFFQLSPFLTRDINKISFRLSEDTFEKMAYSIDMIIYNLENQPDWYWSCRARSYFIDIVNILERAFHNYFVNIDSNVSIKAKTPKCFKEIIEYINSHLEINHTLDSLYSMFYINKNQIESLFKEQFSMTFHDYLKNRRYEEASYYLRYTELDGEQIASKIGFSTSQNFCRFFKTMCGQTPNKFRKNTVSKRKNDETLVKLSKEIINPNKKISDN